MFSSFVGILQSIAPEVQIPFWSRVVDIKLALDDGNRTKFNGFTTDAGKVTCNPKRRKEKENLFHFSEILI